MADNNHAATDRTTLSRFNRDSVNYRTGRPAIPPGHNFTRVAPRDSVSQTVVVVCSYRRAPRTAQFHRRDNRTSPRKYRTGSDEFLDDGRTTAALQTRTLSLVWSLDDVGDLNHGFDVVRRLRRKISKGKWRLPLEATPGSFNSSPFWSFIGAYRTGRDETPFLQLSGVKYRPPTMLDKSALISTVASIYWVTFVVQCRPLSENTSCRHPLLLAGDFYVEFIPSYTASHHRPHRHYFLSL